MTKTSAKKRKVGRPKKADKDKKVMQSIRADAMEKVVFEAAAELARSPLSVWARSRLWKAAKQELEDAGLWPVMGK